MFAGFLIVLAITFLTVIAMGIDMHDMQAHIKHNTDEIKGMHELIHGKDK